MDINSKVDTESICRVCLLRKSELFLIFDGIHADENGVTISEILTECTRYKVGRYDNLPHQICGECMETAREAFRFKRQAELAYLTLVGLMDEEETENLNQCHKSVEYCDKGTQAGKNSGMCSFCMRSFSRKEHLKRHLRSVHKQNLESTNVSLELKSLLKINEIQKYAKDDLPGRINRADDEDDSEINDPNMSVTDLRESNNTTSTRRAHNKQCKVCGEKFENVHKMRSHMLKAHTNEGILISDFQCTFCMRSFSRKEHLSRHLRSKHSQTVESNKVSLEEPEIDLNVDAKRNIVLPEVVDCADYENDSDVDDADMCTTNPISSDDEEELNIKDDANANLFSHDSMEYQQSDEYHEKQIKNKKSNKATNPENRCELCQRTFSRGYYLTRHMLTHLDEKLHECSFCSKRFTRSDHMKNHILNVHKDKDFKCDLCTCAFARVEDLERHKVRHATDPDAFKFHDCEDCGKKFTSKSYLRKHILMHTDQIFECKSCDETFKERKLLREHEKREHIAGLNFLCSICGESFERNDYLQVHMRRHNGEKPFKCQYCDKGFPRATDLKIHERYHTGTKPNLCTLCGKGFYRAYNLRLHMRTHTGERSFKCDHCEKAFALSNDLKSHIRRIHTGERYKCNVCDAAGFLHLYGLRRHSLLAHNIHIESRMGRLQKFLTNPILPDPMPVPVPQHITQLPT